jgi:hypothetical protein
MAIKITDKILCIPPYISTYWSRVDALHMKEGVLVVTLMDGETLHIPNLNLETIHSIFQHHALYLEKEQSASIQEEEASQLQEIMKQEEPAIRVAFGSSLEGLGEIMQHNPDQANAPNLPPEILQKISAISKILAPSGEEVLIPKAEAGCNCFFCQISRALNPDASSPIAEEPEVSDEELQFQQWTIAQTGEKLYSVTNRLDEHEKYHVYLGQPIGCTCGKEGCEHILAVLKS